MPLGKTDLLSYLQAPLSLRSLIPSLQGVSGMRVRRLTDAVAVGGADLHALGHPVRAAQTRADGRKYPCKWVNDHRCHAQGICHAAA